MDGVRMMRNLAVLIGIVLFALTTSSAAVAQTPSSTDDVDSIQGIQESVRRGFVHDDTVGVAAALIKTAAIGTPAPGGARKDLPDLSGVSFLAGEIQRYDISEHAASGFDVWDSAVRSYLEAYSSDLAGIDVFDLDLGDRSMGYVSSGKEGNREHRAVMIIVQHGEYIYYTVCNSVDNDVRELSKIFMQTMIDNDAGTGEETFDKDGASTGGLWDKFPKVGDELVRGLSAFDEQISPDPDDASTPEARSGITVGAGATGSGREPERAATRFPIVIE